MSKENSVRPVMASQPVSLNGEGERTAEEMKKDLDGPQQALCKSVFENDIMPEQAFKVSCPFAPPLDFMVGRPLEVS